MIGQGSEWVVEPLWSSDDVQEVRPLVFSEFYVPYFHFKLVGINTLGENALLSHAGFSAGRMKPEPLP
jgi:hypothetical protein